MLIPPPSEDELKAGARAKVSLGRGNGDLWFYWEPVYDGKRGFEKVFTIEKTYAGGMTETRYNYPTYRQAIAEWDVTIRKHAVAIAEQALGIMKQ